MAISKADFLRLMENAKFGRAVWNVTFGAMLALCSRRK